MRQIRADPALHLAGRRFSADKRALIENAVALRRKPSLLQIGTEGRTRTDTVLPPPDFESGASTSFATSAQLSYREFLAAAGRLLRTPVGDLRPDEF